MCCCLFAALILCLRKLQDSVGTSCHVPLCGSATPQYCHESEGFQDHQWNVWDAVLSMWFLVLAL